MPANVVRSKRDEELWRKAKARAKAEGQAGNYAYVMGIYKKMGGLKKALVLRDDLRKGAPKYVSRKRVGNRWVYKYADDKKPSPAKAKGEEDKARTAISVQAIGGALRTAGIAVQKPPNPASHVDVDHLLSGGLGIKRIDMPQVRSDLVGDFLSGLGKKGVSHERKAMPVDKLHATQNELHPQKVLDHASRPKADISAKPVLVSKDGYILDGHHRWAALKHLGPGNTINAIQVDLPIHRLLQEAHDFEGVSYKKAELDCEPLSKAVASGMQPIHSAFLSRTSWKRVPGAASMLKNEMRERAYLQNLYTGKGMPKPKMLISDGNYHAGRDVVQGLGLEPRKAEALARTIDRMVPRAATEVGLRKALASLRTDHPDLEPALRAELGRRTLTLFREKRRQEGDFIVKSNPPLILSKAMPPGGGNRQSTRGKPARPQMDPAEQRKAVGRPSGKDNGNGNGEAVLESDQDYGLDADNGGTQLDTQGLDEAPVNPETVQQKLRSLHKELHELHEHIQTEAQVHVHNEIVDKMRDAHAKPTPEALQHILHLMHHFAEMVQGPDAEFEDAPEEEEAPNGNGNGQPPMQKSLVIGLDRLVYVHADELMKGAPQAGHKYLRRFKGPGGKWIYVYKEGQRRGPSKPRAEQSAAAAQEAAQSGKGRGAAGTVKQLDTTETESKPWHSPGTPLKRHWVDSAPGLPMGIAHPDGDDGGTFKKYGGDDKTGQVTDEARAKLHDHIEAQFHDHVKPVAPGEKKRAIVMMGGPASGKSTAVGSVVDKEAAKHFVHVDPDAVKDHLPEMRTQLNLGRAKDGTPITSRAAAASVHDESSHIASRIRDKAIAENKHVIVDGTGKNADKHEALIKHLKSKGYDVHLIFPHQTAETAHQLNKGRATTSGRYVPPEVVNGAYAKIPHNFERLAAHADHATMFDSTGGFPPKKVYSKVAGKETDHDAEFMKKFREDHGQHKLKKK